MRATWGRDFLLVEQSENCESAEERNMTRMTMLQLFTNCRKGFPSNLQGLALKVRHGTNKLSWVRRNMRKRFGH